MCFGIAIFVSAITFGQQEEDTIQRKLISHDTIYYGEIRGRVYTENGEPASFVKVLVLDFEQEVKGGAYADENGRFSIKTLPVGVYNLRIVSIEYGELYVPNVKVKRDEITRIDKELVMELQIETLKPIIYFYPEENTSLNVELSYEGQLTTTYPKIEKGNQWNVQASPDGTLTDSIDRTYYSLYWEGIPDNPLSIEEGNVVSAEATIPFLEKSLATLGLNEREANEFIIFWLPHLEKNSWNLISFSTDKYEKQAQLKITPEPETLIRVMMVFQGLDSKIDFPVQDLEPLRKERKGFTVVEWGGQASTTGLTVQ